MPTNAERAARAERALVAYKGDEAGSTIDDSGAIIDLLTDLHHWLAAGFTGSPDDAIDSFLLTAHHHYEAEKHEEARPQTH